MGSILLDCLEYNDCWNIFCSRGGGLRGWGPVDYKVS